MRLKRALERFPIHFVSFWKVERSDSLFPFSKNTRTKYLAKFLLQFTSRNCCAGKEKREKENEKTTRCGATTHPVPSCYEAPRIRMVISICKDYPDNRGNRYLYRSEGGVGGSAEKGSTDRSGVRETGLSRGYCDSRTFAEILKCRMYCNLLLRRIFEISIRLSAGLIAIYEMSLPVFIITT